MPASPALGAIRPAQPITNPPTSAPTVQDEKSQKLQALKVPLLHLVAIRPMSLKFLAQKISCSQDECKQVLEKIGKPARLDPTKWDLVDRAFKELDVWKFDYESDNDRELAIEHTISAYDRLRLSREDKLWQMLLPRDERGKGKILSKLHLHEGPIQKSSTPRIHVQRTAEESVNGNNTGNESDRKDRLAPNDAEPMARSKSSDQIKKQKVSEKEAQSKRLLSKNPRKPGPTAKPREAPKKAAKKGGSSGPVVKSTEFVHDSDEDEEDKHPATITARGAGSKALEAAVKKPLKLSATTQNGSIEEFQKVEKDMKRAKHPVKATSSPRSTSPGSKHRLSDASHSSSSASKLSRQRTTSSPLKPSPLGSSPPTNASDFDNDSQLQHTSTSSTSSTPLIAQSHKAPVTPKLVDARAKDSSPMPQNTSEHCLKRKANDLDSDIHVHNVPTSNGHCSPATKRARTSATSLHRCQNSSNSASDTSPAEDREYILSQAERFKEYYVVYERLHREISMHPEGAPSDKILKVNEMHKRLVSMKDEIARAVMTNR